MIQMTDVSKIYTMGAEEVRALDRVSLTISDGDFVAIVGPSGSGKSTLMNIIGCLDVADSGEYCLDGQAIEDYSENELAEIRNRKLGFIFQSFNLLAKLTALENVELPLIYQGVGNRERRSRAKEALTRIGLGDRLHHRPAELSGGQQQRVAIARAIVTRPSLILADEPTGNLDQQTGQEILSLLREIHSQGNTVVVITHDEHIASLAGRIVHILDGRIEPEEVTA
jgi:putative ABC transport system ATP-binding protein